MILNLDLGLCKGQHRINGHIIQNGQIILLNIEFVETITSKKFNMILKYLFIYLFNKSLSCFI